MTETRIEVTIGAPVEQVWQAVRDPELIRRWHGWHFGDATDGLDDEIRFIYVDHAKDVNPEAHSFIVQDSDRFALQETAEGGTLVRITRAPRGTHPEWDAYYDDITEGWTAFLVQLRFAMERHALAERRMVALTGTPREGAAFEALGIAAAAALPVGAAYTATAATGDALAGEVYARSENQVVLTIDRLGDRLGDGIGDGLLVASRSGGFTALLTLYGTGDDEFTEIAGRWTTWWNTVKSTEQSAEAETATPAQ
ncbi:SRPBCC domain-containing protein [Spongiactinospora sp. TRM90649]|uniref:SRPBCC family protein n=1 Tax=Spongiactinospora sp. TRM90649 TaxID=3031114 RepID=UPI0023F6526B|nr:SRPBCC domain-containing protein [Spongiactinospora sp. TRM90649]MDF5756490.1 SRPBCC domain-containing protein [Spongiactinospora sp. TRM90649]